MVGKKIAVLVALMMFSGLALAQGRAVTVYGGFRDGGHFVDADSDQSLPIDGSGAVSLAFDLPYDETRQFQIFVSHQRTAVSLKNSAAFSGSELDLNITYLHVGGTNFFTGPVGKGVYLAGGIGATYFDPAQDYDSELRASMNLGLGYQLPLGQMLALRFEARAYATLVNSSGGFFCSGGCVISISGDTITQGEVMLGVTGRF